MSSGSTFGKLFTVTTWGESHGPGIGVVVDGCPAGLELSEADIQTQLDRRRTGQSKVTTQRKESDTVRIMSGVFEGVTTGTPISLLIMNHDADSSAYEAIKHLYRPGHADYTYQQKYGLRDWRGSGRASGRETACRVAAGAVARKLLAHYGVQIVGYTRQIGSVIAEQTDYAEIERNIVRAPDAEAAFRMIVEIEAAQADHDSLGGIVEIIANGVPAGLGEPIFDKLDADIGKAMLSIGATKGVEIGSGFGAASLRGSQHNDPFINNDGRVGTRSNQHGGILGGISTGEPILVRVAIKPAASIGREQDTVDTDGNPATIQVGGRHDPTICPRAVPVCEAMLAIVLADHLLRQRATRLLTSPLSRLWARGAVGAGLVRP